MSFFSCGEGYSRKEKSISDDCDIELTHEDSVLTNRVGEQLKSYGANGYVDAGRYYVYLVNHRDISANGDEVAEAMFPNVEEIPYVKGVKVVDESSGDVLGMFEKTTALKIK